MKAFLLFNLLCVTSVFGSLFDTTCDRVAKHGYPCESHTVQTIDGYKLTLFRIPFSHNLNNEMDSNKSAVLLMHGLLSSSDIFVLNGPQDGLPYMLSDAGYDVWFGNARGNDYSQKHIYKSPLLTSFWDFSWHEIGSIDIPTKIDYILSQTGQQKLHYVGHSQGCTTFFVMLSTHPEYNDKIKTSHLLAPPIYMEHMSLPLSKILAALSLDKPSNVGNLIGTGKLWLANEVVHLMLPEVCKNEPAQDWCSNLVFLFAGAPSPFINQTLLPALFETHPVDCSARQLLHYLQEQDSKQFRCYDFGRLPNLVKYGSFQPPNYQLGNINVEIPIGIYYSDNDLLVAVQDIDRLAGELGAKITLHHIKYPEFNHVDYVVAYNVKDVINDCVLDQMNEYEGKPFTGHECNSFI